MPRDGNGNYTLPLPPVVTDTTIESTVENTTNSDLAQAMTDSLSRSGSGGMQTQLGIIDGNVADPGLQFISETQSGFYRASAGDMRNTLLGVDQWRVTSTGFQYWDHGTAMWATPVSQAEWADAVLVTDVDQTILGSKQFNNTIIQYGSNPVFRFRTAGATGGTCRIYFSNVNDEVQGAVNYNMDAQSFGVAPSNNIGDVRFGGFSVDEDLFQIGGDFKVTNFACNGTGLFEGELAMATNKITGIGDGVDPQDAVSKAQLDAQDAGNVKLTGNQTVAGEKTFTDNLTCTVDLRADNASFGALATTSAYGELAVREAAGDNANLALLAGAAGVETADFRATAQGSTGDVLLQSLQGELILTSTVDSIQLNAFNTSVARFNQTLTTFTTAEINHQAGNTWADLHLISTNADPSIGGRLFAENGANNMAIEMSPGAGGAFQFIVGGAGRFLLRDNGLCQILGLAGTGNRAVYSDPTGNLTNVASDASMKTNVQPISYGLAEVLMMAPISYNWIDTNRLGGQVEVGFIAQDMEGIVPEVIGMNSDDTKTIDYPKLVAVMAKAIQELEARVALLEV